METRALLERFGDQLPQMLGGLAKRQVLGVWPGGLSTRPVAPTFEPALYGLDHAHPHPEICLLLAGRCRLSIGHGGRRGVDSGGGSCDDGDMTGVETGAGTGRTIQLSPGDLVMIPGGIVHAESSCESQENYSLAWWILPPAEPHLQVTEFSRSGGFSVRHRVSLQTFPAEIGLRLNRLAAMAQQGEVPSHYLMKEALLGVVVSVFRKALEGGEDLDQRPQAVAAALDYIEHNLHRPLDLAEVGRAVLLSPNYLTSLCKKHTGQSLGSLIKHRRLERAKRLLREHPEYQVKSVAALVGFEDPYSFSRAFRAYEGVSPSDYRGSVRLAGES